MDKPYEQCLHKLSNGNLNAARSALESAEGYVTRRPTAGGAGHGGSASFSVSFATFVRWGQENDLIRTESEIVFLGSQPHARGDEHEVWFHEDTNRWFKATYHNQFGLAWGRDETATPGEYLSRLILQNKYFGDDIQLVALVQCDQKLRVLTSQPHIAGEHATHDEIRKWFCDLQFKCLENDGCVAWYLKAENLLIADAHEGNVIRTPTGMLVPIDLNLIQPEGDLFKWANA